MNFLTSLKVAAATRTTNIDVVGTKRSKFAAQVQQQIAMLQAEKAGTQYTVTKQVQVTDASTGATVYKDVAKRIKQWYFMQNGKLYMQFYYGNKVIALGKKGNAVECANKDELLHTLGNALAAIDAGEFDDHIAVVSKATRAAFAK
jgi:hypothetical protein